MQNDSDKDQGRNGMEMRGGYTKNKRQRKIAMIRKLKKAGDGGKEKVWIQNSSVQKQ